jgi:hypothetical protein
MPALLELQRSMRERLWAGATAGEQSPDEELLEIYRNTITSTLLNALRLSYPAVQRLVGAEFFDGTAHRFITEHPPHSACLNEYGEPFAAFLARFEPATSLPYLSEVAQLEWAVNSALHAPDIPALELQRLSALSESALPGVAFTVHPAVSLLRLTFPADSIWRAVIEQDSDAMARVELDAGPVHLLVERDRHEGVQVRRLACWAWEFTRSLANGVPLHEALEAGTVPPGDALNTLLAEHLTAGRFVDFSSTGEPHP